jgi:hypothetical protein
MAAKVVVPVLEDLVTIPSIVLFVIVFKPPEAKMPWAIPLYTLVLLSTKLRIVFPEIVWLFEKEETPIPTMLAVVVEPVLVEKVFKFSMVLLETMVVLAEPELTIIPLAPAEVPVLLLNKFRMVLD